MSILRLKYKKLGVIFYLITLSCSNLFAQTTTQAVQVGDIFANITGSLGSLAGLFFSVSVIAGLSFAVASAFKFKQHKDNPQQVSVGQPIGLFFLAVIMLWLPYVIRSIGYTLTGATSDQELHRDQSIINNKPKSGFGQYIL